MKKVAKVSKKKVVKKVLTETNFNNKNGVGKQEARDIMVDAIINSNTSKGVILSLPFEECKIERMILKESSKFKFLGCEMINSVYNNMLMTIAKNNLPISTHKGTIGEIIKQANENQFSHLILDYCGQFGTAYIDIEAAINRDIMEVGGAMCVTLNKRISIGTESIYELMEKLNPRTSKNSETRCEHAIRTFINRIGGKKYAIEGKPFEYCDTASMILVIIRRIA